MKKSMQNFALLCVHTELETNYKLPYHYNEYTENNYYVYVNKISKKFRIKVRENNGPLIINILYVRQTIRCFYFLFCFINCLMAVIINVLYFIYNWPGNKCSCLYYSPDGGGNSFKQSF